MSEHELSIELLQPVLTYLKESPALSLDGLTVKKIIERSERVSRDSSGNISFEIVRHHPIGGTQYRAGLPMAALIFQNYRYVFSPSHQSLSSTPHGDPHWDESEWDWGSLAEDNFSELSFGFEEIESGQFEFSEISSCVNTMVTNLQEAQDLFTDIIEKMDFSYSFADIEGIPEDANKALSQRLKDECQRYAADEIATSWEDRDPLEN